LKFVTQSAFSFLDSYRNWGVIIGIGATVTGDMDAHSHPCDCNIRISIYSRCRRRVYRDTSC